MGVASITQTHHQMHKYKNSERERDPWQLADSAKFSKRRGEERGGEERIRPVLHEKKATVKFKSFQQFTTCQFTGIIMSHMCEQPCIFSCILNILPLAC
jgi:hypothetical protein